MLLAVPCAALVLCLGPAGCCCVGTSLAAVVWGLVLLWRGAGFFPGGLDAPRSSCFTFELSFPRLDGGWSPFLGVSGAAFLWPCCLPAVGGLGALLLLPLLWCAWFPLAPSGLSLDCPLWVLFWLCCGSGLLPRPLWVCSYRPLVGLLLPARLCRRLSPPAGGLGPAWGSAPVVPWFRLCHPRLRGVPRVEGPV